MQPTHWVELARHCLLFALVIVAVYTDLARGRIYNWCTLGALYVGLLLNFVLGGLWGGTPWSASLGASAVAIALVLLVCAWPYLKGGIAGGDVKLMLAVAAIGGMKGGFIAYALFFCSLIGALMALLALIWRGWLLEGLRGAARFTFTLQRLDAPRTQDTGDAQRPAARITIPYGVAVACGSVIAWYLVEVAS